MRVSPNDLIERRAFIHLSADAKIKLCHMAGAPWNARDLTAKLSPLQEEVLRRPEREKILHGGSRLGKSVLGGCEGIIALMDPTTKLFVIAARYDHVGHEFQYIVQGLRNLFKDNGYAFERIVYRNSQNYHDFDIKTIWGSTARGLSIEVDGGAALLGHDATDILVGEASYVEPDILEKRVARALDGSLMKRADGLPTRFSGRLTLYTTPREHGGCSASEYDRVFKAGRGDIHALTYPRVRWIESVWIREAAVTENPAYDVEVFEARRKSMDPAAFAEQYLGQMTFRSGRVFSEFDEKRHLKPRPGREQIRQMRLGIGIDTGAHFGAFLAGVDRAGRCWGLGEVYFEKRKLTDNLASVETMIREVLGPAFETMDFKALAQRIDLWTVDPASQQKMDIMDYLDVTLVHPSRGQGIFDVQSTVDQVRLMFASEKLILCDDLTWTIDQIRKYTWKMTRAPGEKAFTIREPRKTYDHLMDAMRFIVVPLTETGVMVDEPEPVTFGDVMRAHQRKRFWGPLKEQIDRAERGFGRRRFGAW